MRIERGILGVTTLGPLSRFGIWTNGCGRNCPGCVSKRLQKSNPSTEIEVTAFLNQFDLSHSDGVTISGGEPFDQASELHRLVQALREKGFEDILIYTGYTIEELRGKHDEDIDYVLAEVAALVDGPYVEALNDDTGNLYGSSNQRFFLFKEKFAPRYNAYMRSTRRMQEFIVGDYYVGVGIPTHAYIDDFNGRR